MIHSGTCYGPGPDSVYPSNDSYWDPMEISPCAREIHREAFNHKSHPRIKGLWNSTGWTSFLGAAAQDIGWRRRSASLLDLDDMLGVIMDGLAELSVLQNTYVFFSSDNGYHLGEHGAVYGKGLPFDHDVLVPLYVTGPTVASGLRLKHPTTNLDLVATIADLAGAAPNFALDGQSFASELRGGDADTWRTFSYSEHYAQKGNSRHLTWRLLRIVNSTHKLAHVRWCDRSPGTFDLLEDPLQLDMNQPYEFFGRHTMPEFDPMMSALASCSGIACSQPVLEVGADTSFDCYDPWQK